MRSRRIIFAPYFPAARYPWFDQRCSAVTKKVALCNKVKPKGEGGWGHVLSRSPPWHLQHMPGTPQPSSPACRETEPPPFPGDDSITGVSSRTTRSQCLGSGPSLPPSPSVSLRLPLPAAVASAKKALTTCLRKEKRGEKTPNPTLHLNPQWVPSVT